MFGTKRVFVKVENGKIIIRVGGGYMQIDEFIELYTPLELEKWESKQTENNLRHKHGMGKITSSVREKSPGRNMSPARASKIMHQVFSQAAQSDNESKYNTFYAVPKRGFASPLRNRSRSPGKH